MMVALAAALSGMARTLFRLSTARRSPRLLLALRMGPPPAPAAFCCCWLLPPSLLPPATAANELLLPCLLPALLACGSRSAALLAARLRVTCCCRAVLSCRDSSSAPGPPLQLLPRPEAARPRALPPRPEQRAGVALVLPGWLPA